MLSELSLLLCFFTLFVIISVVVLLYILLVLSPFPLRSFRKLVSLKFLPLSSFPICTVVVLVLLSSFIEYLFYSLRYLN